MTIKFNKTNIEKALSFIKKHNIKLTVGTFAKESGGNYYCCPVTAFLLYAKELSLKEFKQGAERESFALIDDALAKYEREAELYGEILPSFWQGYDGGRYEHSEEFLSSQTDFYRLGREIYLKYKRRIR